MVLEDRLTLNVKSRLAFQGLGTLALGVWLRMEI